MSRKKSKPPKMPTGTPGLKYTKTCGNCLWSVLGDFGESETLCGPAWKEAQTKKDEEIKDPYRSCSEVCDNWKQWTTELAGVTEDFFSEEGV